MVFGVLGFLVLVILVAYGLRRRATRAAALELGLEPWGTGMRGRWKGYEVEYARRRSPMNSSERPCCTTVHLSARGPALDGTHPAVVAARSALELVNAEVLMNRHGVHTWEHGPFLDTVPDKLNRAVALAEALELAARDEG